MKQILAMLRLDIHLILRDKILWYVLLAPAMMAILLILVSGQINDYTPTFAIWGDIPQGRIQDLERIAKLEFQPDRDALLSRVEAFDNVAGILWENGKVHVVFQGNEGEDYQRQATAYIEAAFNKELPRVQLMNTNRAKDYIVQVVMASLLISPALIGGAVSGFLVVADKEHGLIRGYQAAPIPFSRYIGARSLLASIIGLISMMTLCLIFNITDKILTLSLILLCSLPIFGVITILFSAIAKDKISCIALFKILVVIFLILPFSSAFVPEGLHPLFYPLPIYWQFQSVLKIVNHSYSVQYAFATLGSSLLWLLLATFVFRSKIQRI